VADDAFSLTVARHPREHRAPRRCTLVVPAGFDGTLRVDGREVEAVSGRLELSLEAGATLTVEGAR
jgi:hypothetical protein